MKNFIGLVLFVLMLMSCKKDPFISNYSSDKLSFRSGENSNNQFLQKDESTQTKVTLLGPLRSNPYSVQSMTNAYNTLYNTAISALPSTHKYVKFTPTTKEEVIKLIKSGVKLYEYDLRRKVIEMGEYYVESNWAKNYIPPFYSVINKNSEIPDIPHQILEDLYLNSPDENLIRKSLELLGFDPDEEGYIVKQPGTLSEVLNENDPKGPTYGGGGEAQYCECVEYNFGNEARRWLVETYNGDCSEFEIGNLNWWIDGNSYTPPPPPDNYTTNDCGCTVFANERMPGGCIKVKDTDHEQLEGVRRVKVIFKDTWFTEDEVMTDDNGCFRINNRYKGKTWMWVKFESDRIRIRGTKGDFKSIWEWMLPVKDYVGKLSGPRFNNISVNYGEWSGTGGTAQLYWGAATVNNANHDFHDFAFSDGINPPKTQLDVYVGKNHDYGYALMCKNNDVLVNAGVSLGVLASTSWWGEPFQELLLLTGITAYLIQDFFPDVYVGINIKNSSELKSLAYHEFAHASHFTKVGEDYWAMLVAAETFADGHGNASSNNAGVISLCESWAEHIGQTFKAMKYNLDILENLERTRNESSHHIPIGLYHDLIDDQFDQLPACDQEIGGFCGFIIDDPSSFTNAQMFGILDHSTQSPLIFKNRLITNSNTNVANQVNDLFNSY